MTETHTMDEIAAAELEHHLADLEERLVRRYPAVPAQQVRRVRRDESERFARARVRVFVPILVERAVRERLDRQVSHRGSSG